MSMKKISTTISTRILRFLISVMVIVVSTQLLAVDCRLLNSVGDRLEQREAAPSIGLASISSRSSSRRHNEFRSLAFMLSSGPSKKGPGH